MSVFLTLFATACGDDGDENPCAGVTCERGVCSAGQCVNSTACGGEDTACLDGYTCSEGDVCEARITCTDDTPCGGGTCEDGACVNPEKCAVDDNCVPGDICEAEVCQPDPCGGCDRGVCDFDSGSCIDSDICTTANEAEVCLDGSKCVQQTCVTETAFCDQLACDRGECDFDSLACVSAADCQGDDTACLDGFYCDSNNQCAVNNCADGNSCTMGVCERSTGDCVNAEPCTAASECTDGFTCITDTCVPTADACDPACTGNQICNYDAASLSATCEEDPAAGCTSALDCTGERYCDAGTCADPVACVPDALEPNETAAEASVFADQQTLGVVNGLTLCSGDVDVFSFDTTNDPDAVGTFVANVKIDPADVGLGVVTVKLFNPSGTEVASESSVDANGIPVSSVTSSSVFTAIDSGAWTVEVSSDAGTAGVRYSLAIDVVDANVASACESLQPLSIGTPITDSTSTATSTAIVSSCGDADGTLNEKLYEFTVTERSYVTARIVPLGDADLVASFRGQCTDDTSEVADGCVDGGGAGDSESVSAIFDPGTYVLVVEPFSGTSGGDYSVILSSEASICTEADNVCADAQTLSDCNENETAFDSVTCDNGCDSTTNECALFPGDVCEAATVVDPATGYSGTFDWESFENDYDPGVGGTSCVPQRGTSTFSSTDGPDHTYVVDLADGKAVSVLATIDSFDDIAVYATTDCNAEAACFAGANSNSFGGDETLFYQNNTGASQTIYIILDVETDAAIGNGTVDISVFDPICVPGESRCVLNRESQTCAADGQTYDQSVICYNGCDAATGTCNAPANDTCDTPEALIDGITTYGEISAYTDVEGDTGSCGSISSGDGSGEDAFYTITAGQFDLVTVTVTANGWDPMVWIADGCTAGAAGSCLNGADGSDSNGVTETFTFTADTAGDYLLVVEPGDDSSTGTSGSFTVTAEITPPVCDATTPLGCNAAGTEVESCESGQIVTTVCTCVPGAAACAVPGGDVCSDPIPLAGSGTVTGNLNESATNAVDFAGDGQVANCGFDGFGQPDGNDTIYSVPLAAGETFEASFTTTSSSGYAFIQESCGSANSCIGVYDGGSTDLAYFAQTATTIFVIVDASSTFTSSSYTLDYTITPGYACAPNTQACIDANTIRFCDDGFTFRDYACSGGCSNGACAVDNTLADTCATAVDVGTGAVIWTNADTLAADSNPSCASAAGGEAYYSVTANPGDIIQVTNASVGGESPSAYIFTDCADIDGTCLAGDSGSSSYSSPAVVSHTVTTAGTYYIALDNTSSFNDEPFRGTIEVRQPECTSNDPISCNAQGTGLLLCNGGFFETYLCDGGCTVDACDNPTGDVCADSIVLNPAAELSGTETGGFDQTNALDTGGEIQNACAFDNIDNPDGGDTIYSVSLTAGQVFEAVVDPQGTSGVVAYMLGDCSDPAGSCLGNDPFNQTNSTGPITVRYRAEATATYTFVVDRDSTSTTGSYSFDWTITDGLTCAAGQYTCLTATTAAVCNSDGTAYEAEYNCIDGCTNGYCATDNILDDTCVGARTITADQTFFAFDFSDHTNDIGLTTSSCVGDSTPGPDMFYRIDLAANETVEITATSFGAESPYLYVFTDCANAESTCLAGADDVTVSSTPPVYVSNLTYQSGAAPESVIIAFDGSFSSYDEPVFVEVAKRRSCVPGSFQGVCADAVNLEVCGENGIVELYQCNDANNDGTACVAGACDEPVGDVCVDPFVATPDPTTGAFSATGTLVNFTNDFDLGAGNACTGAPTPGREPVYAVDLAAGETLTANLVSTEVSTQDLSLYIATDCAGLPTSCLAGSDNVGSGDPTAETATYTSTNGERVYIFVDSFFPGTLGGYSLTGTVQ